MAPTRILQYVLLAGLVSATLYLLWYPHVWNLTPVPDAIGTAVYRAQTAKEYATFVAKLNSAPAATGLPVPVIGVRAEDVADSYGAARGSDRSHEGLDIFAPRGTYIISATEGIVLRMGTNRLGGNIIFVMGPGGERYYYAHLDSFDPALSLGQRVGTTTILGRVGTSGNATGTPPHLHFGIYGNGGARNPFERLQ